MHMPVVGKPGLPGNPLEQLTLDDLRERRSVKWRAYPADVLPLWVAEMDVALADPIRETLITAVERGDTGYAHDGEVAEAFAGFANIRFSWKPDPAACLVFPDVIRGIATVIEQVTKAGDGVVINPPVYHPFFSVIAAAGRVVVPSPLVEDGNGRWCLDFDDLEARFAMPDVTAYLVCNPHNPTGTVWSGEDLLTIAALAERHGVRVLVDEIHAPLVYGDVPFVPFLSLADQSVAAERAFVFTSATKAWNLAGLVTGLTVAGPGAVGELNRISMQARHGAGLHGVLATEAAFRDGGPWLDALLAGLEASRNLLADLLAEHLPLVRYRKPEATYLGWLDCRPLGMDGDPAQRFLRHAKVAVNSGATFGPQGAGHVRLNFATSKAILTEAVTRMATTPLRD